MLVLSFLVITSKNIAQVSSYMKTDYGASINLMAGKMNIYLLNEKTVEVRYTSLTELSAKQSLVAISKPSYLKNFSITDTKTDIFIATSVLKIGINRKTEAITYADLSGNIILAEAPENGKTMNDTTIAGIQTHSCATSFLSPKDEGLFGLGCHPLDSLSINYKGRDQDMAIKYLTGAIPVLLSTKGYGLLWDNYAESKFHGAEAANTEFKYVSESGKMIDYYFFYGPSFDQIIDSYRKLTGTAPMYPRWAYGLFQSQDRYKKQEEVLDAAEGYRKNHIPVDAIVQDWFYWSPLPIGSHVLYPAAYPDPKGMIDKLHNEHIHAMISIWPCFGDSSKNFDALKAAGYLTDVTWDDFVTHQRDTYYDAHNPGAREMYWAQARDSLIKKYGWDAWWVDQCEPDTEDPNSRKKSNFYTGKGIDYFNSYSLQHTAGIYEKWRRDIPNKRIFLLARQAFAGQQRNAATLWSSDISCTFHDFKGQVPQAINACASGLAYWTSDIGGYVSRLNSTGIPDWAQPSYRELFIRWFQFGAFSPIFRIHGRGERALFSGNWDAQTKAILLKFDNLRYRLLPYIYSLASKMTIDNYTIMRSLAFDFRNDTAVNNIPDEYMFGNAFLVSPVTSQLFTAVNAGQLSKTRNIYLPKNTSWYNFWTGEKLKGGQTINADATLDIMPLYVRQGSIIPMGKFMEYATQKAEDTIELRIYSGADGQFNFYEDANDNYNYEHGEFSTFSFQWNDKMKELSISARKGNFPGMLQQRVFNIVLVKQNTAVGVDEAAHFNKVVKYDGTAIKLSIQ